MKALCGSLPLVAVVLAVPPSSPAAEPADTAAVVRGDNAFAFELYAQLRSKDGNLFFSPYSISAALAMTSAGARGRTLDEMNSTLHFPPQERLHPAFKALNARINGTPDGKRGYRLSTANALWAQKGFDCRPEFLKLTRDHYGAGVQEVDFGDEAAARRTINAWVEKETHEKIKDLLPPGSVDVDTRLVLTNAIYFKGDWASQFKKDQTKTEPFRLAGGGTVRAELMHQSGKFRTARDPKFQALELPYAGKDLAMLILLPHSPDGLPELERTLTADKVNRVVDALRETIVDEVVLPKFKTTAAFSLRRELERMGMGTAFTHGADFGGIREDSGIYVKDVVHKAFVEVNEEGTEAAAATAVILGGDSAHPGFRADHPFVFLIRDTRSGSILFLGRITDPTK